MVEFLLEHLFWVALASCSLMGISWTLMREGAQSLDPAESVLWLKNGKGIVIDLRAAPEFARGKIPLSRNIPAAELKSRMGELDKFRDRPVLLVCATGAVSRKHLTELVTKEFKQARVMRGGIAAWVQAQMPIFKK